VSAHAPTTRDVLFLRSYSPRRCPTSDGLIAPFCANRNVEIRCTKGMQMGTPGPGYLWVKHLVQLLYYQNEMMRDILVRLRDFWTDPNNEKLISLRYTVQFVWD
jgi:hypothetical protein